MRLTDSTRERLESFVTEEAAYSAFRAAINELCELVRSKVDLPPQTGSSTWEARIITPTLLECRTVIEQALIQQASGYTALRWLWYLRRLPNWIFSGKVATTYGYDSALAETITSFALPTALGTLSEGANLRYNVDGATVRRVLKLCAGVRLLSDVHVQLRLAGKGALFSPARELYMPVGDRVVGNYDWPIPKADVPPLLKASVALYDERHARNSSDVGHRLFSRMGSVIAEAGTNTRTSNAIMVVMPSQERWSPIFLGSPLDNAEIAEAWCRFTLSIVSFDKLKALAESPRLQGTGWCQPEVGTLLQLLGMCFTFFLHLEHASPTIGQYGYFGLDQELFLAVAEDRIGEVSEMVQRVAGNIQLPRTGNELLETLRSMTGTLWPMSPGSPVRQDGNRLCIDLFAATFRLTSLLEFPQVQGEAANARADHFELAVQESINASSWKPLPALGKIRGRTLRHQGRDITDIDAIGSRNKSLLLVSCKSLPYSGRYDIGDYDVIRNAATMVENAVAAWREKWFFFKDNPIGTNYDFSQYEQIIAVVCTPFPVYVPIGPSTEYHVPGLRCASSLSELNEWLNKDA